MGIYWSNVNAIVYTEGIDDLLGSGSCGRVVEDGQQKSFICIMVGLTVFLWQKHFRTHQGIS